MNSPRFDSGDRRLILVALIAMVVSVLYIRVHFWQAFPQASINLKFSKEEITARARAILEEQGLRPHGGWNLTLFADDETARYYLERELGLAEANRLMSGRVSVWAWRARWFHPPEKEEFVVWLSPDARWVGFHHIVAEDAAGARLSREEAYAMALRFLEARSSEPHRLVQEQVHELPRRLDYEFTWELEGFRAKDATYRRTVVVQGDRIGYYREFLHVPEEWERNFQALRSGNALFQTIAESLYLPLGITALAMIFRFVRRRDLLWRPLVLYAVVVGGLMVANEFNSLPFFLDRMPTSSPLPQSLLMGILQGMGSGVAVFFYVLLAAAAGEPLYRKTFPAFLALRHAFTLRGIQTREFFRATVAGYGFAAVHIAFVVAFYVYGQRVGVWSPQDIAYSDLLSTAIPWIAPLAISLLAASAEEFWFRLFAIPLLGRVLPRGAAIVIPALIWGFLHSNYPQQPGYVRGIEVGVVGIGAGYLMHRYGILATLVWHYTVDAVLIGMFLFQSPSAYFRLSGVVVGGAVLLPLGISLAAYYKRGGFLPGETMANGAFQVPASVSENPPELAEAPLSPRTDKRWLWITASVLVTAAGFLKAPQFGDFIRVRLSRSGAAEAAAAELRRRGLNPASFQSVTSFTPNLDVRELEYLRRQAGASAANRAVQEWKATAVWWTRYFRPMQKEEWRIYCGQDGRVFRLDHLLDEKAPGANLDPVAARRAAENYLTEFQGVDVSRLRLVDEQQERRDRRTDYRFVWEDTSREIAGAKARLTLTLVGDEPSQFRRFWKLPEEWVREFEKPRIQKILIPGLGGALLVPLLLIFVRRLGSRQHVLCWKLYSGAALVIGALAVGESAAGWRQQLARYDTAIPLDSYLLQSALTEAAAALLLAAGAFLGALAFDVFRQAWEGRRRMTAMSPILAVGAAILTVSAASFLQWLTFVAPGPRLHLKLWELPGVDSAYPAITVLRDAAVTALLVVCIAGVVGFFAVRYLRPWFRWLFLAGASAFWAASESQTGLQAATYMLAAGLAMALIVIVYRTCGADFVGLAVTVFWASAAATSWTMLHQPASYLRWNGVAALIISLAVGLGLLARRLRPD